MGDSGDTVPAMEEARCRNCGAALTGPYCAACGQRDLEDGERRFGHLVREAFAGLTNLDNRFWRTFLTLLFRPGRLSRDYIGGRRAHWLAPITVFLLVNVLYFLAPALTDFSLSFEDHVPGYIALQAHEDPGSLPPAYRERMMNWGGQFHSPLTAPLVERRVAQRSEQAQARSGGERSYTFADYRRAYERLNDDISKLLIGLHLPVLGLALLVLFWRSRLYYAEHFVVGLHLFSFLVLLQQLLLGPTGMIAREWGGEWFVRLWSLASPVTIMLALVYFAVALRRVYRAPWWWSVVAMVLFVLSLGIAHLLVYRTLQFLVIFALT